MPTDLPWAGRRIGYQLNKRSRVKMYMSLYELKLECAWVSWIEGFKHVLACKTGYREKA